VRFRVRAQKKRESLRDCQVLPQQVVVIRAHRLAARLRELVRFGESSVNACESRRVACCVGRGGDSLTGDFAGIFFVATDGVVWGNEGGRIDASADMAVNVATIIATMPNAKKSPTSLMEYLAARRRVMCSAPMNILSSINFAGIVARRFPLSDMAYVDKRRRAALQSDSGNHTASPWFGSVVAAFG
jgi:hypothetical protein